MNSPKIKLALIGLAFFAFACPDNSETPNNITTIEAPDIVVDDTCKDSEKVNGADHTPMRLLTRYEYDNTVRDLLGVDSNHGRISFPVENASEGFESTPENTVSDLTLRKMLDAAELIAGEANTKVQVNFSKTEEFDAFLLRAFRRPPSKAESDKLRDFYEKEILESDVEGAKKAVIMAVLMSPQFLYRIDLEDEGKEDDLVLNEGYKVASRLSYFLWGSMPDEILFNAAKNDELKTKEEVKKHVLRMLKDERARELVGEFYRQWLGLNALTTKSKDKAVYPNFDNSLTQDYLESAMRFVKHVHFDKGGGDVKTLLTSDKLFLTPDLAKALGEKGDISKPIAKPGQRAGILTHPALMFLLGYPDQTSPIHRGIFVRERVLCQPLPAPPMNLNVQPPELDPALSTRERFKSLTAASFCMSCHVRIDPLGFGFENYDSMGAYRSMDANEAVDNSGTLSFTRDPSLAGTYDGGMELANRLSNAAEVQECIGANWFQFAYGRRQSEKDTCQTQKLLKKFSHDGGNFEDLMVNIATSDTFRYRLLQGRK